MSRAKHGPESDEKRRGLRPWESVRASKVQRARELIKDPGYPSKKVLDAVAGILAKGVSGKRRARRTSDPKDG